jgi:hypothetical protein
MNSEQQNQGSKTLNRATLELEIDRVVLGIDGVVATAQKTSAHQSVNEPQQKKGKKGKKMEKKEREKQLPSPS